MRIHAKLAYLPNGWAQNVALTVKDGLIADVAVNTTTAADHHVDTLLPALSNLHSHSFQRIMAGLTEQRAKGRENFWTWRATMYRALDHLTPDHMSAIAELAFMEMLEAGFAAVAEFHYLHHAPGGQRYDNPAELSARIMQAAKVTGIGLTHLPVLYTHGGVDERPLQGGQHRFGNTLDQFTHLLDRCHDLIRDMPADTRIGVAPHSLRAVSPDDLTTLTSAVPEGPIHIHIAEQIPEVEALLAQRGARPVEWLLTNADVSDRWCLIHATHMTSAETTALARSGATAGLCPVTEANLGDGRFPAPDYLAAKGAFGIGTDSNINISLAEELRLLEYGQRLTHRARNLLAPENGSTGTTLYLGAAAGGAQALDRNTGTITPGKWADLVALNSADPRLCHLSPDHLLDGFVFASTDRVITDVWSAGRHRVTAGQHVDRPQIIARYRRAIADLSLG